MKNKAQYLQNEEIWWRMGAELWFLSELADEILSDDAYRTISTAKIREPLLLCAFGGHIDNIRYNMAKRMVKKTSFDATEAFYRKEDEHEMIVEAVKKAREAIRELGKTFMQESHERYAGLEDMSLDEAIQNAVNVMERAQAALDTEDAHEKPP